MVVLIKLDKRKKHQKITNPSFSHCPHLEFEFVLKPQPFFFLFASPALAAKLEVHLDIVKNLGPVKSLVYGTAKGQTAAENK